MLDFTMRRALAMLLCCLFLVAPRPASAQSEPDAAALAKARERYARAVELFDQKDFGGALIEFEEAHRITGRWEVLYNIGLTQLELKQWQASLRTLRLYLDQGGAAISAERRDQVERHMTKSRSMLATVAVTVVGDPATIEVDGRVVGTTPLAEPLLLLSGKYAIGAKRAGYRRAAREMAVLSGNHYTLDFELELIPTTARLTVRAGIPKVSLQIDGKVVGLAPWTGVLPAGGHNVVGSRSGYRSRQLEVGLVAGKDREVNLTLSRVPTQWHERWYVWAGISVIVIGSGAYAYYLCCTNPNEQIHVP